MKSQGLVKPCLQVWPQDGVGPSAEAADDREPGEGAQDGHPLGSHLRCHRYGASSTTGPLPLCRLV